MRSGNSADLSMSVCFYARSSRRLSVVPLVATLLLMGCGSQELQLPSCWTGDNLKTGQEVKGLVSLQASAFDRPVVSSVQCGERGSLVELPAHALPSPKLGSDPTEIRWFEAYIEGRVAPRTRDGSLIRVTKLKIIKEVYPQ